MVCSCIGGWEAVSIGISVDERTTARTLGTDERTDAPGLACLWDTPSSLAHLISPQQTPAKRKPPNETKRHDSPPTPKPPHNTMHDRDILPLDIVNHDIANLRLGVAAAVPEE